MCGIAFVAGLLPTDFDGRLQAIARTLERRGPDEAWYFSGNSAVVVTTRLALYRKGTPLSVANNDPWLIVTLNGEIWNASQIATSLGIDANASEIEILRALYQRDGTAFADQLDGMYTILIIDLRLQRVVLCRDHVGIKPMFYGWNSTRTILYGASDLAALAAAGCPISINPAYLANIVAFGYSDNADTLLEGIHQVEPGVSLIFDIKDISLEPVRLTMSSPEAWRHVRISDALHTAIERCVRHSDGLPVGLLLSGGMDSTLLAAMIAEMGLQERVTAITLGNSESGDVPWARRVAKALGFRHVVVNVDPNTARAAIEGSAVQTSGHPSASLIVAFALIAVQMQGLRIVICGEGSDELFGGYPWHRDPVGYLTKTLGAARAISAQTSLSKQLISKLEPALSGGLVDALAASIGLDSAYPLVDRHLVPLDHASMSVSMELRVPFLDRSVWSAAQRLEIEERVGQNGKAIIRTLLHKSGLSIAPEIIARRKLGFPAAYAAFADLTAAWATQVPTRRELVALSTQGISMTPFQAAWFSAALTGYEELGGDTNEGPAKG